MDQTKSPRNWISRRAAAKALGIDPSSVPTVAKAGAIRIRQLPGMAPQFNAADVARVLAEAEAPTSAGRGAA